MKGKRLPAYAVTPEFLVRFETYLAQEEGNSRNTIVENLKILSYLLSMAGVEENPFRIYKMSREQPRRNYLVEEDLQRLMALPLRPGIEESTARDIFYVECRTGLRISDLLQLRWCDFDGRFVRIQMQKTKRRIEVPVSRRVCSILSGYRTLFSRENDTIFPELGLPDDSIQDSFSQARRVIYATARVNYHIKRLAARAGIDKPISTHVGRHTFATTLLDKGASIYEIKELLGHQDVKVTQIYAHVLDSRKQELVEMLE